MSPVFIGCDTHLYEHIIQAVLLLLPTGFEELSPLRGELDPRSNHADSLLETVTSTNTEFIPLTQCFPVNSLIVIPAQAEKWCRDAPSTERRMQIQ
jgi:hypothetical protein